MHNAVRHASAAHIRIELNVDDHRAELAVTDDGRGFDPTVSSGGVGLATMRERAAELGAEFEVGPAIAVGTAVRVRVPLTLGTPEPARAMEVTA